MNISNLLNKEHFSKEELVQLLSCEGDEKTKIFEKAAEVKAKYVGKKVYFRGLIEMSNLCRKNCLYCGIRAGNTNVHRYDLTDEEVVEAAKFAWENRYGSIAIQTGEVNTTDFVERIENLLDKINQATNHELGITLSLGEQTEETYRRWFNKGAIRYLLRIEASNRELYAKLHPNDKHHDFDARVECLKNLRKVGYQVGTGVMIGLPFQTLEHLAEDLLWMQEIDVDMVGMGPYIEHPDTPLFQHKDTLLPINERFNLALKMTALLRIIMKDINIAAPTALQAIDPLGREKAIKVGANVVMPNITPGAYRNDYKLYENKPCIDDAADDCKNCLEARIQLTGDEIGYGEQGNSKHFCQRIANM
ncbi:[FeFe] hydrogenase H-cluster radical SAM maturase HydE [Tenuifilum thalassicum]|uniref:[FeFe] hydrogenase H-cluster radical SAM maturase HydE n=1 Tax=Tenuifilum thalassicum TaxID=2590900 RepID=A0A7D3XEN8_9BACT|nr:[FeFe] hydrogenase H-cluster radical SAM maturase HydE [Tenuifilum thalassicum]QKG80127.1 [FeFe] hydrogenase H-cluster radical SAM maturase HydE [Tenuifilum thalassicum]